ncbi:MFS transporter [Streptomyces sp. NBC_01795]|uniref:MFS transporter n=1 Tax=Streptomyces sp. NBC_01795 TaxID=2975943 RepID=UPI002DDBBB5F|nr:MFS transporter [Streptomyces sp. NBC_01795]WSA94825.1 MFS transporter [Streptomyces sp. NBC_01795]
MPSATSTTASAPASGSASAPPRASSRASSKTDTSTRFTPRETLVLVVLCASQFLVALDFSVLNVALPVLGPDLGLGEAGLQWAVTAFALPTGSFLLLFGRLGDQLGRRRTFLAGLALFTVASVIAATGVNAALFLAGRALQGLGAAALVPTGMALITTSFAEGPKRTKALSINGSLMALGFTVGMVLGGVLTDTLGWRSTMGLLGVGGVLVLLAAPRLLTESWGERTRLDVPGALAVTGGLFGIVYGLSTAAEEGFTRPDVLIALLAGVALLAVFIRVEARSPEPLLPLWMLRRPNVAFGNLAGLATVSMMTAVVFLMTLYLQDLLGVTALVTGLIFGVQGLASIAGGALAPRLARRMGTSRTLALGLLGQAVLTAALLGIGPDSGVWLVVVGLALASALHLVAVVSYGVTATSGLADEDQGRATSLVTSAMQVGMALGIPLLSALSVGWAGTLREGGVSADEATLGGIRLGVGADVVVLLAVGALVALTLGRRRAPGAEGAAEGAGS